MARNAKKQNKPIEYSLLLTATLCLIAFGAIMVFSASSAEAAEEMGDSLFYLKRYVIFGALGLVALHFMSRYGLQLARRFSNGLLIASFVLLFAVLLPGVGMSVNGASRWIGAGPIQVQPSEIAKLALVLYAANLLASRPRLVKDVRSMLSPLLVVVGVACLLIMAEPDLGTVLVISFTVASMLIVAGANLRHLGLIGGSGAFLAFMAILIEPYRRERLLAFLSPSSDPSGSGFQIVQAKIAMGSGGLFGKGLGESVQKAFYLPEAHTDMILAVIGEELGLIGVFALLGLFGIIAYAGLRAAKSAKDRYTRILCAGLVSMILCQAALNFFAVLGIAPLTGVPLPFISYGGSNLVVFLAAVGLILNIASKQTAARKMSGPIKVIEGGRPAKSAATKGRASGSKDRYSVRGNSGAHRPVTRTRRRSSG